MNHYPASIRQLIKLMARLPGIGEKTAERLALHLLYASDRLVEELARSILEVKQKVRLCSRCFSLSDAELCTICSTSGARRGGRVRRRTAGRHGGGGEIRRVQRCATMCCPACCLPLNGVGPDDIRIRELIARVTAGGVREVVLATGTSVEGEATAAYIAERLARISGDRDAHRLGSPHGGRFEIRRPGDAQESHGVATCPRMM